MNEISKELIAPCGMNCAICSRYLAYRHNLNRRQCRGCRSENKKCTYLFEKCTGINNGLDGNASAVFCYECNQYPCSQINRMNDRYRKNYSMSVKDNLDCINIMGIGKFTEDQYEKYRCLKCGGLVSVHNKKCFKCDKVTKLVEKYD